MNRSTYGNNQAVERAAAVLTPAVVVDRGRRDRPTHHDTSEVCNPPRGVVGYSVLCAAWRFFIISNHSGKRSFCRAELRSLEDPGARTRAVVHRNRKFADSPQEGAGFELPVPRVMQARLEAKIAGFGCMFAVDYLRLPSVTIR